MSTNEPGFNTYLSTLLMFSALLLSGSQPAVATTQAGERGDVTSPQIILETQKPPVFPPAALAARYTGSVMLEITVDKAGKVSTADVLECSRPKVGFEEAAVAAVKKWRFEPGRHGGDAVEFTLKFRLNFNRAGAAGDPRVTAGAFTSAASTGTTQSDSAPSSSRR